MKKILLIFAIGLIGISRISEGRMSMVEAPSADFIPPPVLLQPKSENVDLTDKEFLEFKWSPHEGASGFRDYYDFRIYNGYKTVEETLLFKEKLAPDTYQYNIKADRFQDGAVYTWTMRQLYTDGRKSAESHNSFKVIKHAKPK